METVTSISGGKTSAYLAANYPTDHYVFSLVRTSDKDCMYPDKKLRQIVSDKIGKEFIGTLEDDVIIHTILDLEQFIGKKINWVSGVTFDELISGKYAGILPSVRSRYCTSEIKILPIFNWWNENFKNPVEMQIGFRANEVKRAKTMIERLNKNGLLEQKAIVGKRGKLNKWGLIEWQKPIFPLVDNFIYNLDIINFWGNNSKVRFAKYNNCIGCFNQKPQKLKAQSINHPKKFNWFIKQEFKKMGRWKENCSYKKINETNFTGDLFAGSNGCNSGFCGF